MALLNNSNRITKELSLHDGVLKTNGALVSMQISAGWAASMSAKSIHPGLPSETFITFKKDPSSKTSFGIFFSGQILEEFDGQLRKEELFDRAVNLKAGSAEATRLVETEGALANVTHLRNALLSAGRHAVQSEEKDCLAVKTSDFNGLKAAIFEFQNERTGTKAVEYCLDVLGNGTVVYSLYYRAPIETFADEMDAAISAFRSTIWRQDFDPMKNLEPVD